MHVIVNRIHFGNFRFIVELEADPEIEVSQLILWVAEKIDVRTLPLDEFAVEQLIYAVKEPLRSKLYRQLEMEKQALQYTFAEKVVVAGDLKPRHLRKKTRELQREHVEGLMRIERNMLQNELLTLDKTAYDLEILQAESHIFAEERFLCRLKDKDVDESWIRQFCFEFAFDSVRREQILAEAALQRQPTRPNFAEGQDLEEG
jgi:hypothetical protein